MATCAFCDRPSFTAGWTSPTMCEQHFDLALIRAALVRTGRKFTVGNVQSEMQRKIAVDGTHFHFSVVQVPELVQQMCVEDWVPATVPV